jgi:hypothetical protein
MNFFLMWFKNKLNPLPSIPTPERPRVSTLDKILHDDWFKAKQKRTKEVKENGSTKI